MRDFFLLLLFIIPLSCFGQLNDTIFHLNGKVEPVYNIDAIYKNRVYYTPIKDTVQVNVSVKLIERITSKNRSINNESLINFTQDQSTYRDTIHLKSGNIKSDIEITKVTPERISYAPCVGCPIYTIQTAKIDRLTSSKQNLLNDFNNSKTLKIITNGLNEIQITPVQYNLYKFYKQKRAGHFCMGAGIFSGIIYGLNPLENTVFAYISGGLSLASFIIDIDSYKWIKRASLVTNPNSVTLKVNF